MKTIYLDHNATTPLHPEVKSRMSDAMDIFGNPSSMHAFGRTARQQLEQSRETVASFIGALPEELIFVGSGSEANNTVLSLLSCPHCVACNIGGAAEIITTAIEHPCILETSKCLTERGVGVIYLNVDRYGMIDHDQLAQAITSRTQLVSVMMANNEIGTIQDVKRVAKMAHERGVLCHSDAVQAVGKIPVDVRDLDVDFLTLSAHKMYGPKGIGALYVKQGLPFCPLIRGGHQEKGRRAGTENTLGIIGFAAAVEMRRTEMDAEYTRLRQLKEMLIQGITTAVPDTCVNGHPEQSLVTTANISFAGAEGEAILLYLDMEGIAVSTGSACASGSLDPSHVLLATGISAEKAHGSIRMSMGRETTEEDIAYVLEKLPPVIEKIRKISTTTA